MRDYKKARFQHYRVQAHSLNRLEKGAPPLEHLFRYFTSGKNRFSPDTHGGHTVCQLISNKNAILATGVATCSMSDNFCYATGRELAFQRALDALEKMGEFFLMVKKDKDRATLDGKPIYDLVTNMEFGKNAINILLDYTDPRNPVFVEIEDDNGKSIGVGISTKDEDLDLLRIRITAKDIEDLQ